MTAAVMAAAMKMKMMPKPAEPGLTTLNHLISNAMILLSRHRPADIHSAP